MSKITALTAAAGLVLSGAAFAAGTEVVAGAGGAIPDGAGGNIPGPAFTSMVSTTDGDTISNVWLDLDVFHSWTGDLAVTLSNTNGDSADIFIRVGAPTPGVGAGDSSNLSGVYTFMDGGADFWAAAAAAPGSADIIAPGTYTASTGGGAAVSLAGAFGGASGAADWTLSITDNFNFDTGSVAGWTLYVETVPTPGAAALFGVAGLAGIRRRR